MKNFVGSIDIFGDTEIIENIYDTDISKIFRVKINGEIRVLKIKRTSFNRNNFESIKRAVKSGVSVVKVFDFKCIDGITYFILESLDGVNLSEIIRDSDIDSILKISCKELYRLHRFEEMDDISHVKNDNINGLHEIKVKLMKNVKLINRLGDMDLMVKAIKIVQEFLKQLTPELCGMTHGDLRNLDNIIVDRENKKVKIIDTDSIRHGIYVLDAGMLYNTLKFYNKHDIALEYYTDNFCNKEEMKRNVIVSSIFELLRLLESELDSEIPNNIELITENISEAVELLD